MSISMALFSPPTTHLPTLSPSSSPKPHLTHKPYLFLRPKNPFFLPKATSDNGAGSIGSVATTVEPIAEPKIPQASEPVLEKNETSATSNGSAGTAKEVEVVSKFEDPRWVNGTWDLKQFQKDSKTDWDAVIDAGEVFFYFLFFFCDFLVNYA